MASLTHRPPAVAGMFYPESPSDLRAEIAGCFERSMPSPAPTDSLDASRVTALVVPHAGYIYSGSTAATAYALLAEMRDRIRRVVLLGPAHRVAFSGLAVPTVDAFDTPLGPVPLAADCRDRAFELDGVIASDAPHAQEHALEVQLPFLQVVLGDFELLPVVVGHAPAHQVATLIERFAGTGDTLILVSSDLSHFHRYADAQRIDSDTIERILACDGQLVGEQACGAYPLNGLALAARKLGWQAILLSHCNSGDTAGDRQRVVGYASFAFLATPGRRAEDSWQ